MTMTISATEQSQERFTQGIIQEDILDNQPSIDRECEEEKGRINHWSDQGDE